MKINHIYQGDCIDVLRELPDKSVDCCITSPPYNIGRNHIISNRTNSRKKYIDGYHDYIDDYTDWCSGIIDELLRVCKYHVMWNVGICKDNKTSVFELIGKYKSQIKELMIWYKTNPPPNIEPNVLMTGYETILCLSNDSPDKRKFYHGTFKRSVSNVYWGKVNSGNPYCKQHSAVMPEDLDEWMITNFTEENDTIIDPFMGVGTSAVMAHRFGRNYVGIELNPEYIEIAERRIQNEKDKYGLLESVK